MPSSAWKKKKSRPLHLTVHNLDSCRHHCISIIFPASTLQSYCVYLTISHIFFFFFFNDTATTEIYTLSLHDALPIWRPRDTCPAARTHGSGNRRPAAAAAVSACAHRGADRRDRKSTRLNSSHANISYAVFCLEKKKIKTITSHCTQSG